MRTRPDPFAVVEGRLLLEQLPLSHLAEQLEGGGAAWLIGATAARAALASAGSSATVSVDALGAPALLAMASTLGCWAAVTSSHELSLAMAAGFPGERIVVRGRVQDDGLLAAAVTAAVAVIEPAEDGDADNLMRIATGLGRGVPAPAGAPADLPAGAFAACGGLFARVLRGPPAVALDAAWPVDEGGTTVDGRGLVVWPLRPGTPRSTTLEGLAGCGGPVPARIAGEASRGDWVVVPWGRAAAARAPDLRHPVPETLLVDGDRSRALEPRPLPPRVTD